MMDSFLLKLTQFENTGESHALSTQPRTIHARFSRTIHSATQGEQPTNSGHE